MDMMNSTHAMVNHAMAMNMAEECDGTIDPSRKGSWQGHILPGSVFVIWGAWWAYSIICNILHSSTTKPYRAQPWFQLNACRVAFLEPLIKVLLPPLAISVELYWDHAEYRYLYCPPGTKWAGRYAVTHMNNWQHTSIYPGFFLSGLADLLCLSGVPLPAGTGQGMLALAYTAMTFVMGMHKKHEALDAAVHGLLAVCMALVASVLVAELLRPRAPGLGLLRAGTTVFLGAWLCEVGIIEFDSLPQWSTEYSGAAMFVPVVWAMIALVVASAVLTLFASMAALKRWGLLPSPPPLVHGSGADGEVRPDASLKLEGRTGSSFSMAARAGSSTDYAPVATRADNMTSFNIDV